jgi:hypothetical protein
MPIVEIRDNSMQTLAKTSYAQANIQERKNLQHYLKRNFRLIDENVMIIGEEFNEWDDSQRRIDLLAVDKSGNLVVIELKRTEDGATAELQAVRYAAMVSSMSFERAVDVFQNYLDKNDLKNGEARLNAREELLAFLDWDDPAGHLFADDVKMILISADFSKELTTSVLWLNDRDIEIRCFKIEPYKYGENTILVNITQVIPLPEASEYQIKVKAKAEQRREQASQNKDYTKYTYNGDRYGKAPLVLAVISEFVKNNPKTTYQDIKDTFTDDIQGSYGCVATLEEAQSIKEKSGKRHYMNDDQVLTSADNVQFVVCTQWGTGNITTFLAKAKALEFVIE